MRGELLGCGNPWFVELKKVVDITVVILTHNEEIHIERCIQSLQSIVKHVYVVDSFSTDRTVELAESLGAEVVQRKFINQAEQFQWAIDTLSIESKWTMRMDADEYLEPTLIEEIKKRVGSLSEEVKGAYFRRQVMFMGRKITHGDFAPHILMRLWRTGQGHIEQRWMDEHIVLPPKSESIMFKYDMVDDNRKGITFWVNKHNAYASREMVEILNTKYNLMAKDDSIKKIGDPQAKRKRLLKEKAYAKLPPGFRALLYFCYRYFLRLGFLDGWQGFIFHSMQGFWYRMLVDVKIMEIEERSGGDVAKIKQILAEEHGIKL